jgi:3-keto-5-aminohexanoate cleavage enzyme
LQAEPEMASLNMGTLFRTIGPHAGTMFANSRADIELVAKEMLKRHIKPEMEVYHHGMLREVNNLISNNLVEKPYYVNFVMGMAYQGAVEGTPENLFTLKQLLPADIMFNVCAIGPAQLPMTTLSMLLGGMVRVGMEDNIYYSRGVLAKSNAQLVERSARIAKELGVDIASPDEAREMLGIIKKQ